MTPGAEVVDDAAHHRFVLDVDGVVSELVYRRNGRRLVLVHTGVPEAVGGRGIGGRLVAAAVEQARVEGLTVVPVCPYVRKWLGDHADVAAALTVDWAAGEAASAEQGAHPPGG